MVFSDHTRYLPVWQYVWPGPYVSGSITDQGMLNMPTKEGRTQPSARLPRLGFGQIGINMNRNGRIEVSVWIRGWGASQRGCSSTKRAVNRRAIPCHVLSSRDRALGQARSTVQRMQWFCPCTRCNFLLLLNLVTSVWALSRRR